jgi:nitroreductase
MDTMQAILERSVRKYKQKEVLDEVVRDLAKTAIEIPLLNKMNPKYILINGDLICRK